MNAITFYLEDINRDEGYFNGVTLTFSLQIVKIKLYSFWMNLQNLINTSYCVGGRHHSSTTNLVGDTTINKKIGKEIEILIGRCSNSNWKKFMPVSDTTRTVEVLGDFFKNLSQKWLNIIKKMAEIVLKKFRTSLGNWSKRWYCIFILKPWSSFVIINRSDHFLSHRKRIIPWEICIIFKIPPFLIQ